MPDTTMSAAFAKAKMKSPAGRLKDMAQESLRAAEDGTRPGGQNCNEPQSAHAAGARLKEFAKMAIDERAPAFEAAKGLFLERLMDDAKALNALMGDAVQARAAVYLHEVWNEMRGTTPVREHERGRPGTSSGGHSAIEAHITSAARPSATRGKNAPARNGGGQERVEAHAKAAPAALSPDRVAGAKVAGAIVAKSLFDAERINGRPIGDMSYREMRASALRSRDTGLRGLGEAYVQVRLLKSVAYHEGMDSQPARDWASEDVIRAAKARFTEFGHLLTAEIDTFLKIEDAR